MKVHTFIIYPCYKVYLYSRSLSHTHTHTHTHTAIPSFGFSMTELNHDMNVSKLAIPVKVTGNIVRTFNATVSVEYPEDIRGILVLVALVMHFN